ncbi:hypothetical protein BGW37DRAFT_521646 [Umbelopsis sp. PMI_123]|nr:hypothetical protein BGW37DRAFT_521646 [Umbelopsis sp. PMI_123]
MLGRILSSNSRRILQHTTNTSFIKPTRRDIPQWSRRQYANPTQLPNTQPEKLQSAAQHFKRQKHLPFFLEYFMWVVFGSEALHLIWLKIDQQEYNDKTNHQIAVLKEIITRLERGESVDDNLHTEISMLLLKKAGNKKEDLTEIDDEYLEKLFVSEPSTVKATAVEPLNESSMPIQENPVDTGSDTKKKPAFFL